MRMTLTQLYRPFTTIDTFEQQEVLGRTNCLLSESELLYDCSIPPISSSWRQAPWYDQHFSQPNIWFYSLYVTSSLTRGWIFSLQLPLTLASTVILRFDSLGTRNHILLSQIRDSTNLEGQVPVFICPRNRLAQFPLRRLLRLAGLRWRYSSLPPHGGIMSSNCIEYLIRRGRHRKHRVQQFLYCVCVYTLPLEHAYRSLATAISSGSTVPTFRR
jgi:hypothetical protein